ncbi:MAG: glycosyltransferase family 4 protein [Chloroflexi bacterium]|nr:glycosyltransferase family 4 protein [Chloroflexota bacterium]
MPRLALVSIGIRRDLLAPLRYISKFELLHFYRRSVYGDLTVEDLDATLRAYSSPLDLYQQLVRAKPAVIQGVEPFSYYTQPYLWACYCAARKTDAALLVATLENRPLEVKFGNARAFVLRKFLSWYFQRACLILVLNQGARENVLACGGETVQVQSAMWGVWGVDIQEFFPRVARDPNMPPTILFAGRLHPEKGVFVLLDAFAAVHARLPHARLVLVGEGPARNLLEQKIRQQNLALAITLTGVIKHREMVNLFHQADVFCAPSITTRQWAEQVGAAALQAMACGIPIVSTRSGAIPEYIPDGAAGILVEEQNAPALADALLNLLTNPQRASEMGQRGRAYACLHYDAHANVQRGETLVLEHCVKRNAHRL